MPPIIIAIVAAVAAYGAGAAAGVAIAGTAFATFLGTAGVALFTSVVGAVVGAVVAYAGNALLASTQGKAKTAGAAQTATDDAKRTVRSTIEPRRVVYGRARVSGPLIYAASFGPTLEYLLLVIPLCDHPIDGVEAIFIGEFAIPISDIRAGGDVIAGRFARSADESIPAPVSIRIFDGTQTTADPQLVAESPDGWRAQDRLLGIAHLVVRLRFSQELFASGIPSISAQVRGKKVFDPRNGVTQWSENWSLCVLDFLRSDAGINANDDEIELSEFSAAANLSDEAVQITAAGTTQARYTLNGTFTADRKPIDVLEEILAAGAGSLVYVAGRYRLYGGAFNSPTVNLNESNLASGVEIVTKPPRRELFNAVRGNYINPDSYWQAAPFTPLESIYVAQDGEVIFQDFEFPWILDSARAQRLAYQLLLRSRQGVTIRATFKYEQLNLSVWQTVSMSIADLGFVNKPFRILSWSFQPQSGLITLTMQEEQVASYAWSFDFSSNAPEYPDTTLVNPLDTPAPVGLTVTEELYVTRDGAGVRTKALLVWQPPLTPFVTSYDIEYKELTYDAWKAAPSVADSAGEVLDLEAGTYEFRVRAATLGAKGPYATVRASIGGLAASPPAAVTGLSLQAMGGMAYLRWARSDELDVRVGGHYEIRHSADLSTPSWVTSVSLGDAISGEQTVAVLPLKTGVYFIRPVDAGGVYGAIASTDGLQVANFGYNVLATLTENPTFAGAKTNTVFTDSTLRLVGTAFVDTVASFDAIVDVDALGGFASSGSYAFTSGIDLGVSKNVRVTSRIVSTVSLLSDTWDLRVTPLDEWAAIDAVVGGEADAFVELRTAPDSGAGPLVFGPFSRVDSAEYNARAFEFRAQLRTFQPAFNIHLSQLSVTVEEAV